MSLLVLSEILGLFANTFTINGKYYLRNSESLRQTTEMQLSKKHNILSRFVPPFLKFASNLEHFESKDEPHS